MPGGVGGTAAPVAYPSRLATDFNPLRLEFQPIESRRFDTFQRDICSEPMALMCFLPLSTGF